MLPLQFITWWYGQGWRSVARSLVRRNRATIAAFSIGSLAQTMFAPWRRIISYPGASLGDHFHAWLDNLVSRIIGFLVRFFVLMAALIVLLVTSVLSVAELVLWPCLPPLVIICIIKGLLQ
jgi:hypothetical protein